MESCGFPEVASAVLLQAVDMESVVVNTEYLSVGNHGYVGAGMAQYSNTLVVLYSAILAKTQ